MTLQIAGTDGNAILNALTHCDTLEVYGILLTAGFVAPAHCADAPTGDLIISYDLTAWGTASGGVLDIGGLPITSTVNVTGQPIYFRLIGSGGTKMQGTCSFAGGGGDLQFPSMYLDEGASSSLTFAQFVAFNDDS